MGLIEKIFLGEVIDGEIEDTAEAKLIRFILHGKLNLPVADVADLSSLSEEELTDIQLVLSEVDNMTFLKLISVLHMRQMICLNPIRETIPFLLAQIAKTELTSTLEIAQNILISPESFVFFVKYSAETKPFELQNKFQSFISEWYEKRDYKTLADLVAENPGSDDWTHRRIMSMGHDYVFVPQKVIHEYALNGYDLLRWKFFFEHEATPIIEYFSTIEYIKKTTDSSAVCKKINLYNHGVLNVNEALHKDKNVNKALIKTMEIRLLLNRLLLFQKEDFFRNGDNWDMQFVMLVCYRLNSPRDIRKSKINPSESLIALESYLNKINMENEFAFDNGLPLVPEPSISSEVVAALESQMETSFVNISEVDVGFNVFINCHGLSENFCGHDESVRAHRAAAVLALSLKKCGRNVKIFTSERSKLVELKEATVSSLSDAIGSRCAHESSTSAKHFALLGVSVIIGLSLDCNDFYHLVSDKNINSTVVLCNLSEAELKYVQNFKNMLVTVGFNEKTFNIISTYLTLTKCYYVPLSSSLEVD